MGVACASKGVFALALSLTGLALVTGCSLEPRYRAPPLPTPDRWPIPADTQGLPPTPPAAETLRPSAGDRAGAASPAGVANSCGTASVGGGATLGAALPASAREIGWRDFFADPRLQELIARALKSNRDLRVAVLNVALARAQFRVQRAARFPEIDAGGQYTKENIPAAISGVGVPIAESYYQATLAMPSFELDLFGRVRSLSHAALEQYLAQVQARRSAQLSLIAQVATAYLTLASDRELERLAQETLASQEDSYRLTVQRHGAGAVSGLDVAQARTTVEAARFDVARYGGNIEQDIDTLALLVGAPVDPSLLPQAFDGKTFGLESLPAGLPSTVLLRRPDVLQAEHTLRAEDANIGAARAAFFPTIDLTGNFGVASTSLSTLFEYGSRTWTLTPQATLPLFAGGRLTAGLSVARSQRDIAVAQYEKAIQTAFREVADALALTATLAREREAQVALVDAARRAYELSQQLYKAGRESYLSVLDSQRSYYGAQQSLIQTRLAEQDNRVTLYQVLGGGWREHSGGSGTDE